MGEEEREGKKKEEDETPPGTKNAVRIKGQREVGERENKGKQKNGKRRECRTRRRRRQHFDDIYVNGNEGEGDIFGIYTYTLQNAINFNVCADGVCASSFWHLLPFSHPISGA